MTEYLCKTAAERPDKIDDNWLVIGAGWAEFMQNDAVANEYFGRLYADFPDFQFMLLDGETVVAACNSIPLVWNLDDASLPDTGWDWALESGFSLKHAGGTPTTLGALSITVARAHLGEGISRQAVLAMKTLAARHGFNALIAPVRPSLKELYPLAAMERYACWLREDGTPFDPWLRTHWRLGARIVKVASRSMVIPGTVAQWQRWTGLKFPESGVYVVPGALNPVSADVESNSILYVEPNVWMHHPIL